jgi:hypothetical protein
VATKKQIGKDTEEEDYKNGAQSLRGSQETLLKPEQMEKRLKWAQEHIEWTTPSFLVFLGGIVKMRMHGRPKRD